MKKRGKKLHDPWVAYADLMSALLLVFALLLTFVIMDYKEAMADKEQQIKEITSTKENIILALSEAFKKSNVAVDIDKATGAIRLPGNVLFDKNSTEISDDGKTFLKSFIPKYVGILLQPKFRDSVSNIIIEGHTDKNGTYLYNMELSQARAYSVFQYIYSDDFPKFTEEEVLKKYVTANGRSFSVPLTGANGKYDENRSRRVEFLFRLKEDEAIKEIGKLVKE